MCLTVLTVLCCLHLFCLLCIFLVLWFIMWLHTQWLSVILLYLLLIMLNENVSCVLMCSILFWSLTYHDLLMFTFFVMSPENKNNYFIYVSYVCIFITFEEERVIRTLLYIFNIALIIICGIITIINTSRFHNT